jgi:hypothetical protein
MHAGMDKDNANKVPLELLIKELNVHIATLSEVLPDNISRLVTMNQFSMYVLNLMLGVIDLQQPVLQEMLSDSPLVVRVRGLSSSQNTGPVKWEVKF